MITTQLLAALALSAVAGYLLGSINSAILICRAFYGADVRQCGSGNAGMTNVARSFGKKAAVLTLAGDILKGVLAVLCGRGLTLLLAPGMDTLYGAYAGAIAGILGHMFPVFFGFKGGKGVATSGGVILCLQPVLAAVLITIFLVVFAISRMVSLSSIIGISLYPLTTALWYGLLPGHTTAQLWYATVCAAIIAGLVVWMHRANIGRIRAGTEYKFGQKKPGDAPPKDET